MIYEKDSVISIKEKYPQYIGVEYLNMNSSAQVVIRDIGFIKLDDGENVDIVVTFDTNNFPFSGVSEFESFLDSHYLVEKGV